MSHPSASHPAAAFDPVAELARLDLEIGVLAARAEAARQDWWATDSILRATQARRDQIAATLAASTRPAAAGQAPAPGSASGQGTGPALAPTSPSAVGRTGTPLAGAVSETSTRTVQNVLFILGGLLLATAAIVFTAVAWATFGVGGRATILAVVTVLALAAPLVALRRRLTATAETFAFLGLLLVLLDGYAARYVNLFGVADLPASRYAAMVCLTTALIAVGYRVLTRLGSAAVAALLVVQPVIPLLVAHSQAELAGWSATYAAVALLNVAVVWWWRRRSTGLSTAIQALAWTMYGLAIGVAGVIALGAQALAEDVRPTTHAGLALCLVGLVLVAGAMVTRFAAAHTISAAVLTLAVIVAAGHIALVAWPNYRPIAITTVVAVVAVLARLAVRILPSSARSGPRAGALIAAGALGLGLFAMAVAAAGTAIGRALPAWHANLAGHPTGNPQTVAGLALVALALVIGSHRSVYPAIVAVAVAAGAMLLPESIALVWWAPAAIDVAAAAVLAIVAILATTNGAARTPAIVAAVLTGHAVAVSLARSSSTAAVAAALTVLGALVAIIGHSRSDPARFAARAAGKRHLAGPALAVGLVALPAAVGAALATAHIEPYWVGRATTATVGLLVLALAGVRRWWPALVWPALCAVLLAAVVWPTVDAFLGHESVSVYAAVELLLLATALLVMRAGASPPAPEVSTALVGVAAVPGALLLIADVAGAFASVLLFPYSWLSSTWSGRPTDVGLIAPNSTVSEWRTTSLAGTHAIGLGILAIAVAVTGYALTRRSRAAITGLFVGGPSAILIGLAATNAPWPTVSLASLGIGWLMALMAGFAPSAQSSPLWKLPRVTAAVQSCAFVGAGLAGALPMRWSTLVSLGGCVIVGAIIGVAGNGSAARALGWLAATATALTTAAAAGLAAALPLRDVAFLVLGVAALALHGGAVLRRRGAAESVSGAVQAASFAGAVVALAFTIGWTSYAAAVLTVWGIVVGARSLWPATSRAARGTLVSVAAASELLAWWLLLADRGVAVLEAYTVPLAAVALLAGWVALRARPELRSWAAYGPALAAAFLPGLATILTSAGEPWRRLALGIAALVILVAGAARRRQAPVVTGALVLAIIAVHELVLVWDLLPRWIPLAAGGVILVGLAITYERRRRDMAKLTTALRHMR